MKRAKKAGAKAGKKGILLTLLVLILFLLMLSEAFTFVLININYNKISQNLAVSSTSGDAGRILILSSSTFAQASMKAALQTLADYELNASLRNDNFVTNASYFISNLMISGMLPNVTANSRGANMLLFNMNNATLSAYNALVVNSLGTSGSQVSVNETRPYIYQSSPYTLSVRYTENVNINSSSGIFDYNIPVNATVPLNGTLDILSAERGVVKYVNFGSLAGLTSMIGDITALEGSRGGNRVTSAYGTVFYTGPGCTAFTANLPLAFRTAPLNRSIIIATMNAMNFTGLGTCNANQYGGIVTNSFEDNVPGVASLIYPQSFNLAQYLHTGMKALLYGPGQDLLNISNLQSVAYNNKYFASPFAPSFLDRASNNFDQNPNGIFTLSNLGTEAAAFNGQNSYVSIPGNIVVGSTSLTVCAWINPVSFRNANGPREAIVSSKEDQSGGFVLAIDNNGNMEGDFWVNVGSWQLVTAPHYFSALNKWYYVCGGYDGSHESIFVNGELINESAVTGSISQPSGPTNIGSRNDNVNYFFNGSIADVQIYNTALSPSQIQHLYTEGIEGIPIPQDGLVGWWPLNGNANDYGGNGNSGTGVNTAFTLLPAYNRDSALPNNLNNNLQPIPGIGFCDNSAECGNSSLQHVYLGTSQLGLNQGSLQVANFTRNGFIGSASPLINTAAGGFNTVSFWMDWPGNTNMMPFSFGSYDFWLNSDTCAGFNTFNSDVYGFNPSSIVNRWVFVTATFINNEPYTNNNLIYINGARQTLSQCGGTQAIRSATNNYQISGNNGDTYTFVGQLANFQIYNTSLTQSQINQLYSEGIAGSPLSANLVAWYPLDGNANDYSGNGNTGIQVKMQYSTVAASAGTENMNMPSSLSHISSEFQTIGLLNPQAAPPPIVLYEPIQLYNAQTAATPNPFQYMLTVDSATYSSYEASNLQNIEFFYPNGTVIPSWLESCSTTCSSSGSSSTSTVYWLKLTSPIPAGGYAYIYMGFAPTSVNMFGGGNNGEAPQLSPTYAEYDDGKNVFSYYQAFGGLSSLPTGWSETPEAPTLAFNTQNLAVTNTNSAYWEGIYENTPSGLQSQPVIFDAYANIFTASSSAYQTLIGEVSALNPAAYAYKNIGSNPSASSSTTLYIDVSGTGASSSYTIPINQYNVYSVADISSTDTIGYVNYANEVSSSTSESQTNSYFEAESGEPTTFQLGWIRARAYPPSGVMPSATFLLGSNVGN